MSSFVSLFVAICIITIILLKKRIIREFRHDFYAKTKGKFGEYIVRKKLESLSEEYHLFHNIIIHKNNYSTQIDHLIVSIYGVFVIETKNYKGKIYGSEKAEYWKQFIYGYQYQLYNPIKQNNAHILTLMRVLGFSKKAFIPIVVFIDDCTFHLHTESTVCYLNELINTIKSYNTKILNPQTVQLIIDKLNTINADTSLTEAKHIQNTQKRIYDYNQKLREGICPKCRGRLVQKRGKYGTFFSCSNYPKCKFTYNI